jgi:hypothetical protein
VWAVMALPPNPDQWKASNQSTTSLEIPSATCVYSFPSNFHSGRPP